MQYDPSNTLWKDIKGYEGEYQISSAGEVRSLDRIITQLNRYGKYINRSVKGKTIKPIDNGNGYLIVGLRRNQDRKNFYIHRLMVEYFINEIPNGYVINHKDFNTYNNSLENLEIVTQKQNVLYSIPRMRGPRRNLDDFEKRYIRKRNVNRYEVTVNGKYIGSYKTIEEAQIIRDIEVKKWVKSIKA